MNAPARVAAGTSHGGQFATTARAESSISLPDQRAAQPLPTGMAEIRHGAQQGSDQLLNDNPTDDLATALGRLRALAANHIEDEVRLITAEYFAYALSEGDNPGELAADIEYSAPEMLLGLNIEEYESWEPADRPGESDNHGYDWDAIALDVSGRWDSKADRIARGLSTDKVESEASAA